MYRLTIRIRPDDTIRPKTNTLFRPLFGTKANMKRIFGTSLVWRPISSVILSPNLLQCPHNDCIISETIIDLFTYLLTNKQIIATLVHHFQPTQNSRHFHSFDTRNPRWNWQLTPTKHPILYHTVYTKHLFQLCTTMLTAVCSVTSLCYTAYSNALHNLKPPCIQ